MLSAPTTWCTFVRFDLLIVSHADLTVETADLLPLPRPDQRRSVKDWIATGSHGPLRVATSADSDELRRLQRELAAFGVRALIAEQGASTGTTPRPAPREQQSQQQQESTPRPSTDDPEDPPRSGSASRSSSRSITLPPIPMDVPELRALVPTSGGDFNRSMEFRTWQASTPDSEGAIEPQARRFGWMHAVLMLLLAGLGGMVILALGK